jgi:hypothetical protein
MVGKSPLLSHLEYNTTKINKTTTTKQKQTKKIRTYKQLNNSKVIHLIITKTKLENNIRITLLKIYGINFDKAKLLNKYHINNMPRRNT